MAFINGRNLEELYGKAHEVQARVASNFQEFSRMHLGIPPLSLEQGMPPLTDPTTFTIVNELAKRIVPRPPEANVTSTDPVVECQFETYMNQEVLPNCNMQAPFHSKIQLLVENAGVFGIQFADVVSEYKDGEYKVDFWLPYVGDTMVERGVTTAYEAQFLFLNVWFTKGQLSQLIVDEEAKRRQTGSSTFDPQKLRELLKRPTGKQTQSQTFSDAYSAHNQNEGYHLLVKCYQLGKDSPQYYFSPNSGLDIIGQESNADTDGMLTLIPNYYRVVLGRPYGLGVCEVLNGMQRSLDQRTRFMTRIQALGLNPMFVAKGVPPQNIKLRPSHVVNLPSDEFSSFGPVDINTQSITNFTQDSSLNRSLMYNQVGAFDQAATASAGIPGFSKTDTGVKTQVQRLGTADQSVRANLEHCVSQIFKALALKIVSKKVGRERIEIDKQTFLKLNGYDPKSVEVDEKRGKLYMVMDWNKIKKEGFKDVSMKIDPEWKAQQEQRAELLAQHLTTWMRDPRFDSVIDFREAATVIVKGLGFDDNKLIRPKDQDPEEQRVTPNLVQQIAEEVAKQVISEQNSQSTIKFDDVPEPNKQIMLQAQGQPSGLAKSPKQIDQELDSRKLDIEEAKLALELVKLNAEANQPAEGGQSAQPQTQSKPAPDPGGKRSAMTGVLRDAIAAGVDQPGLFKITQLLQGVKRQIVDPALAEQEISSIVAQGSGGESNVPQQSLG